MNILCPSCQKMLQVPDQFAGQMMKCPLCGNNFTVPSLPAAGAGMASAGAAQSVSPAAPAAGYQTVYSFQLNTRFLAWIPTVALTLVVFLLFLPWLETGVSVSDDRMPSTGWQTAFGDLASGAGMLYVVLVILSLMLSVVAAVLPLLPAQQLPPALQQVMPWRSAAVAVAAALVFLLLALQLGVLGFGPESNENHPIFAHFQLRRDQALHFTKTVFVRLALFCHLIAVLGAGLDAWVSMRGPSKPPPRIDINL